MMYGAVTGKIATDVCFVACSEKVPAPTLFCLHSKTKRGRQLRRYFLAGIPPKKERVSAISANSHDVSCDVAVIDGLEWDEEEDLDLKDAKLVILYDLSQKVSNSLHEELRANVNYSFVVANLEADKGFVVYRRNDGDPINRVAASVGFGR